MQDQPSKVICCVLFAILTCGRWGLGAGSGCLGSMSGGLAVWQSGSRGEEVSRDIQLSYLVEETRRLAADCGRRPAWTALARSEVGGDVRSTRCTTAGAARAIGADPQDTSPPVPSR